MAVSLSGVPRWFLSIGSKGKQVVSKGSCLNSESLKFQTKIGPSSSNRKGEWQKTWSAQSDGVHLSGNDSDCPEWSIGWEEPHGPDFEIDDDGYEDDDGFAVLVRCYKSGSKQLEKDPDNQLVSAIKTLSKGFPSAGSNSVQQWVSSLQNF